ncbi:MAG: tRNA lysidine(34) synthetase TilS [bacterium]
MKKNLCLEKNIADALHRSWNKEQRIGLGLSGGMDSILLAECLRRLKIPFVALHFNHRWRGKESEQDAQWVQRWCKTRGIEIETGQAGQAGATSENAARQARWAFFERAARKHHLHAIWLAHHADDLVETFLLQLLRGAGPEGLASLKEKRTIGSLLVIRPWLGFFKEELLQQAKTWKLKWREDASNRNPTYLRNRARHQLLPFLHQLTGRDVKRLIWRTAALVAEENAFWETLMPAHWPVHAPVARLKNKPTAFQRRWLRGWLLSRGVKDLSFDDIETVRHLLIHTRPARVNLSQGKFCRRRAGVLFVEEPAIKSD